MWKEKYGYTNMNIKNKVKNDRCKDYSMKVYNIKSNNLLYNIITKI